MQPAEDITIQRGTDPITLDPSQPLVNGKPVLSKDQVSSRVGIDATRKHVYPALAVPPKRDLDRVAAKWDTYGISEIREK